MEPQLHNKEIGLVRATKHYLVSIEGLPSARVHDIIVNSEGARALVTGLSHDAIEAMLLDQVDVRPGEQFELRAQENQLAVGDFLMGRVINALGDPIDGKGALPPRNAPLILEREAGDLARRGPIRHQLVTGYALVDTVLPIAKGQRQLLMGSIQSGVEPFCRELVRNQQGTDTVCIYTTVGKSGAMVRRLAEALFEGGAAEYTYIIAGTSEDGAPLNTLAPSVAMYMAEFFSDQGRDVVLILDDLYTHAKYLREKALLEGRLPGRESYPGDIFYQQAHLIERAGSFEQGGSITLLPLLQTDIEATTDLIMTNVMGTTDGHLQFSSALYAQGTFPPILEQESVTRVGKHAHTMIQKQLATSITTLLADAKEQERFTQFGSELSEASRTVLAMGSIMRLLMDQDEDDRLPADVQSILLALVFTSFSTDKDAAFFSKHRHSIIEHIASDACASTRSMVATEKDMGTFLSAVEHDVVPHLTATCHE